MDASTPEAVRRAAQDSSQVLRRAAGTTEGQPPAQYLSFLVAGSTYAMGIAAIKEIIEYGSVTRVPLMPSFIRGVINLRGSVVPVIDLAARLGFEPSRPGPRSCIVIIEMQHESQRFDMGVIVDGVSAVVELAPSDLEPPPHFGAAIRSDFIEAMARIQDRFVIVMRVEQVLSIEEVTQLASVPVEGSR
ncbi:MAG: purine-binding chemotaxis protein CheW [Burkholderiaceae bacterium]|nr:purine-binding chemotaxis protein CheW [Rhodoferax sp.]MCP5285188.1 purine-binding chemotaxis protein CheW [Burkholderiaceae bacterium]